MTRPLVTFALIAYNQSRFIEEAVEAAFRQTYQPLEILLSDDCSTDGTYELMRAMLARYSGPHRVLLNRNSRNMGIADHINRVMAITSGELITVGGGDDVSLPMRAERSVEIWLTSGRGPMSVHSAVIETDEAGREQGVSHNASWEHLAEIEHWAHNYCSVTGCSHTWHRRAFDVFGPLDTDVRSEDMTIPFRSLLLGTIVYSREPLVRRRRHRGSMTWRPPVTESVDAMRERARVHSSWLESGTRQQLSDLRASGLKRPDVERAMRRRYQETRFLRAVVDRPLSDGLREAITAVALGVPFIPVAKTLIQYAAPGLFLRYLRYRLREAPGAVPAR